MPIARRGRLLTPEARILQALMPEKGVLDPLYQDDWPTFTRAQLSVRAGYTAISGTTTRALNGVRANSSSGDPQLGLLKGKLVEEIVLDIEGLKETNYRITATGIKAYHAHVAIHGEKLPKLKDAKLCINDRYTKPQE